MICSSGAVRMSNMTLVTLALVWFGPCREDVLCCRLLLIQAAFAAFAFAVRFGLAGYFYDVVGY